MRFRSRTETRLGESSGGALARREIEEYRRTARVEQRGQQRQSDFAAVLPLCKPWRTFPAAAASRLPYTSGVVMSSISAILAPTNTGKTHRAVERMLEHATGMIGLPLRLLAREVYDRITALLGESEVALVTGEEKRIPARPRYWICTVESMPLSREVDFLAVDEIQLAAHHQRGHVFSDRLLNARGKHETWFLGAETMRPVLRELVPEARVSTHPRLSQLRYAGVRSLRSLPPRSAVVAFSVSDVYELAERLRQRRGGVAVVLGALSPRTRNAQVALYQSGEVQYMVATDAIGMGLNMDVDHIAFASLRKYDGRELRALEPAELAQIAGRAGRYIADGSFGLLAPLPELPAKVARAIEGHRFRPVERLIWRNSDLDLSSLDRLVASLSEKPTHPALSLVDYAEDFSALMRLRARPDIRARADGRAAVSLLWDVCRIPDFRKLLEDSHVALLAEIFLQLSGPKGRIERDFMNQRIGRLDDTSGDIDLLTRRIAFIRTWTYVSHRSHWVDGAAHFRERTRVIEDRLSDALHERLVMRFVERERRRASKRAAAVDVDENHPFYKLAALRVGGGGGSLPQSRGRWVDGLVEAEHGRFRVAASGEIWYRDEVVARLTRGAELLRPEVTVTYPELGPGAIARVRRRLVAWSRDLVADGLGPLRHEQAQTLSHAGRGLVYQLEQGLGTLYRRQVGDQLRQLSDADRATLDALGVRIGGQLVYVPSLHTLPALTWRLALQVAYRGRRRGGAIATGAPSIGIEPDASDGVYLAIGYAIFGGRAIRADLVERIHRALLGASRRGPFVPPASVTAWLGGEAVDVDQLVDIIADFGYRAVDDGRFVSRRRRRRGRRDRAGGGRRRPSAGADSNPRAARAGRRSRDDRGGRPD